jgi:hypothetical protein
MNTGAAWGGPREQRVHGVASARPKPCACAGAQGVVVLDPYARAVVGRRSFGELGPVRACPCTTFIVNLSGLSGKGTRGRASEDPLQERLSAVIETCIEACAQDSCGPVTSACSCLSQYMRLLPYP